jgi:hypothetical protein
MSTPTNEQRPAKKEKPLRMDAYYYEFERTGVLAVDRVLSAVASAGKCYHNTADWNETDDAGKSPVDAIQDAANAAAAELSAALSRIEELAKDARRLDWLEDSAVAHGVGLDGVQPSSDAPVVTVVLNLNHPDAVREFDAHSLRAAVDAAMSSASSSGANTP